MKIREYETKQEMFLSVPNNGIGAEVGVCKGMNSINLWHLTRPSKMYLCDVWRERHPNMHLLEDPTLWEDNHERLVGKIFSEEIEKGSVELHREWGGNFLYSLPDNHLDWLYLDACHDYKPVSIELENGLNKVKKGGFIMGHDYGVNAQVWKSGVIRAVNEKIQEGRMRMVGITIERWPSFKCEVL